MIDFSEVDKKISLFPRSVFALCFFAQATFLLSLPTDQKEEFSQKIDAKSCLSWGMAHLNEITTLPKYRTHSFFDVYRELESKILNSETPNQDFLELFMAEANDLAELIEI